MISVQPSRFALSALIGGGANETAPAAASNPAPEARNGDAGRGGAPAAQARSEGFASTAPRLQASLALDGATSRLGGSEPLPTEAPANEASVSLHAAPMGKGTSAAPSIHGPSRSKKTKKGKRTRATSSPDGMEETEEPEETSETDEPDADTAVRNDQGGSGGRHARGGKSDDGPPRGEAVDAVAHGPEGTQQSRAVVPWRPAAWEAGSVPVGVDAVLSTDHPALRAYREHDEPDAEVRTWPVNTGWWPWHHDR